MLRPQHEHHLATNGEHNSSPDCMLLGVTHIHRTHHRQATFSTLQPTTGEKRYANLAVCLVLHTANVSLHKHWGNMIHKLGSTPNTPSKVTSSHCQCSSMQGTQHHTRPCMRRVTRPQHSRTPAALQVLPGCSHHQIGCHAVAASNFYCSRSQQFGHAVVALRIQAGVLTLNTCGEPRWSLGGHPKR